MNSTAVIVSSCDSFFDAWRPFAFFFRRFWPDCPFAVYLITNELKIESDSIQPLMVGADRGWASNLRFALQQIDPARIIYFQEDYFLNAPVRNEALLSDLNYATEHDVDALYLRARAQIEPNFRPLDERLGVVPIESDGRTRCQVAIWKRDSLLSILRDGENAWEMESRGSERTREMQILSYSTREGAPIQYLMSAIVRGLWTREALAMCDAAGVEIAPRVRGLYTPNKWLQGLRRAQTRRRLRAYFSGRATRMPVSLR